MELRVNISTLLSWFDFIVLLKKYNYILAIYNLSFTKKYLYTFHCFVNTILLFRDYEYII